MSCVDELQGGLRKLMGTNSENGQPLDSNELYPSIRKLPLLGSTYNDLYRQVSIDEAVDEALTKQYEMARVEEAKEIPTVKVLDPPDVPEEKSYPPRSLIGIAGGLVATGIAALWVLAGWAWRGMGTLDPRKRMLLDLLAIFRSTPVAR